MERSFGMLLMAVFMAVFVSAVVVTVYPLVIYVDVAYENGSVVQGADVVVTCNGAVVSGVSDENGELVVGFLDEECGEDGYDVASVYGDYVGILIGLEDCKSNVVADGDVGVSVASASDEVYIVGRNECYASLVLKEKVVEPEMISFRGVVYDASGVLMEGVDVLFSCDGVSRGSMTTGDDGFYGFGFLDSECVGDYEVVGVRAGFLDNASGDLAIAPVDNVYDFVMNEIPVVPKTVFSGVVYLDNLTGNVVDGADVEVVCNGVSLGNVSDVDGEYYVEFEASECGSDDDFSVYASNGSSFGDSGSLNVGANGTVTDLVIVTRLEEPEAVLVFGKVYFDNVSGELVEGADVSVTCNGFVRSDSSDVYGEYVVEFNVEECEEGSNYSVYVVKGEYEGSSEGVVGVSEDVFIVKAEEEDSGSGSGSSSSGGSGGGWSGCSQGYHVENIDGVNRCILDVVENVTLEDLNVSEAEFEDRQAEEEEGPDFLTRILAGLTGAVVGGVAGWVGAGLFGLIVLGLFLFVWKKRQQGESVVKGKKK